MGAHVNACDAGLSDPFEEAQGRVMNLHVMRELHLVSPKEDVDLLCGDRSLP